MKVASKATGIVVTIELSAQECADFLADIDDPPYSPSHNEPQRLTNFMLAIRGEIYGAIKGSSRDEEQ